MGNDCAKWCPTCKCCKPTASTEGRTITPNIAIPHLSVTDKSHPNYKYSGNKIKTAKYTPWDFLPLNLFKQFHAWTNWYFLTIVVINFIPVISAFGNYVSWIPLAAVLISTAIKDAIEDYQRAKSDSRLNDTKCRVYRMRKAENTQPRNQNGDNPAAEYTGSYEKTTWAMVHPGDLVRVECNEAFPADVLILHSSDPQGVCYIETANLDGESNLKQREVLRCFRNVHDFRPEAVLPYRVLIEAPNAEVYRINGTFHRESPPDADAAINIDGTAVLRPGSPKLRDVQVPINKENVLLRGCKLRNTDFIEGIVIYAGHETKMMMNDDGPRFKRSKLELRIQEDTIYCGLLLFILCAAGAVGQSIWISNVSSTDLVPYLAGISDVYDSGTQGVITFFIFIIYLQNVIPLPLFVSQEIVKIVQIFLMENDEQIYHEPTNRKLACRAWNLSEDLGQIQYVFTDKTGTLTENVMTFRRCIINGVDYSFDDPRVDNTEGVADGARSCSIHSTVTGEVPCPHCNAHVPPIQSRGADINRMNLQSLLVQSSGQPQHSGSYRPSGSTTERRNDADTVFLHHFLLMLTVCNTVVVSAKSHHETGGIDPFNPHIRRAEKHAADAVDAAEAAPQPPQTHRVNRSDLERLLDAYEAESADELALVKAACVLDCRLLRRTNTQVTITLPNEPNPVNYGVLNVLPFDSDRKRMSIIVKHPIDDSIMLYSKGADTSILPQLSAQQTQASNPIITRTRHQIDEYAKLGLRTLCFAKRELSSDEYRNWAEQYDLAERATEDRAKKLVAVTQMIERNLTLVGAVGIEDKLQDQVPETIAALREAGMHVWMLTGDKQETAVNIGYSCRLLDSTQKLLYLDETDSAKTARKIAFYLNGVARLKEKLRIRLPNIKPNAAASRQNSKDEANEEQEAFPLDKKTVKKMEARKVNLALVINGGTLKHVLESEPMKNEFIALASQCKSVLCCRTTPLQKGSVVALVMEKLGKHSLAVGDGANDVSMIKTANIGIGITGREGLQASMASDYAIAKFKYLRRLLLVHGHWSFYRYALLALLIFYKQIIWTMMFFWYQIFNGFSAIVMIDQLYQIAYTLIMTSAPPIYVGILDQVLRSNTLVQNPALYKQSQKAVYYQPVTFWIYFADGFYQSLVVFFIAYLAYVDNTFGMWEFGHLCYFSAVTCVLVTCCIETARWNWIGFLCIFITYAATWTVPLVYNAVCTTCMSPDNPYWVIYNHAQTIEFWAVQLVSVVVAVIPRVTIKIMNGYFDPSPVDFARVQELYEDLVMKDAEREERIQKKQAAEASAAAALSPTVTNRRKPSAAKLSIQKVRQLLAPDPPSPRTSRPSASPATNRDSMVFENRREMSDLSTREETTSRTRPPPFNAAETDLSVRKNNVPDSARSNSSLRKGRRNRVGTVPENTARPDSRDSARKPTSQ